MTQDEIIRMAREAGFDTDLPAFKDGTAIALKLVAIVAAHEREACAILARDWRSNGVPRQGVYEAIRARGAK